MDYFRILNLDGEPFSNSPDPGCFYESRQHVGCLQKLELSMRLRRGLNVVVGEVGTGKTTLCRQLIQRFADDADFETHLVLDPDYPDASAFLAAVADMLCGGGDSAENDWQIKERIKKTLFKKGVEQGKTVVLIIDEGQKIRPAVLEILRELLNYETNTAKLLQIVIFAQTEIQQTLEAHANLADRIDLFHRLGPLGFRGYAKSDPVQAGPGRCPGSWTDAVFPSGPVGRLSTHPGVSKKNHSPVPQGHAGHDHPEPVPGRMGPGACLCAAQLRSA